MTNIFRISLLLVQLVASNTTTTYLNIDDGELKFQQYFGCGDLTSVITSNSILELESGVVHNLPEGPQFCLLSDLSNITIRGSNEDEPAILRCPGITPLNQTGFGFYNISNLEVTNIWFDNCGSIVPQEVSTGKPLFGSNQQAVLTVTKSSDIFIQNITVTNYSGYAVIIQNVLGESRIDGLYVRKSFAYNQMEGVRFLEGNDSFLSGSGLAVAFTDPDILEDNANASLVVSNVEMTRNRNLFPNQFLFILLRLKLINERTETSRLPYGGNGVITVRFSNTIYDIDFTLERATITNNFGTIGGGLTIVHLNSNLRTKVTLKDCYIANNINGFTSGSGIQLFFVFTSTFLLELNSSSRPASAAHNTVIRDSVIKNHTTSILGGGVDLAMQSQNIADVNVSFINTEFSDNEAAIGDCLVARRDYSSLFESKQLRVYLDSVKMFGNGNIRSDNNDKASCVIVTALGGLFISGSLGNVAVFSGHSKPAIRAIDSHVFINGTTTFVNNSAGNGAALYLSDNSHLFFIHPSQVLFQNNSAVLDGGAIYIDSANGPQCEIQFVPPAFNMFEQRITIVDAADLHILNYSIAFVGNHAHTGDSIYAKQIYNCTPYPESVAQLPTNGIDKVYQALFTFEGSSFLEQMRSRADGVCYCHVGVNKCIEDATSLERTTFSGLAFSVEVMIVDVVSQPVDSVLYADIVDSDGMKVRFTDKFQRSITLSASCSKVNYTVLTKSTENSSAVIELSSENHSKVTLNVVLNKCPLGFTIHETSNQCECTILYQETGQECNISSGLITRQDGEWIGMTLFEGEQMAAYSRICPAGYCVSSLFANLSEPNSLCTSNREGEICGRCKQGFSAVFGSDECHKCSNVWILTILLYLLLGILLILLIDRLELTVTNGTINGIIFYAQMTAITDNIFSNDDKTNYVVKLVSFINLEIGLPISLCFYDGMTDVAKHGLQFVFPVYLWLLIITIIALRRFSGTDEKFNYPRSVQILVTLIYISYGKLLTAIAFLYLPVVMQVEENFTVKNRLLWFFDGTQPYFQGWHLVAWIVGLIIFFFFVIPYKLLILFSQWCLRFRFLAYYIPIVDANVAPFKNKFRFWFGLRLIIAGFLILESVALTPQFPLLVFYINTVILTILTTVQAYVRPYKSTALNVLDLSFLINLTMLYVFQLYAFGTNDDHKLLSGSVNFETFNIGYESSSAGIAILTFIGIIVYHIVMAVKKSKWFMKRHVDVKTEDLGNEQERINGTTDSSLIMNEEGVELRSPRDRERGTEDFTPEFLNLQSSYSQYRESAIDLY